MDDLTAGGKKTIFSQSKSFRMNASSMWRSSRKTGFCPAVTSGRKFVGACHCSRLSHTIEREIQILMLHGVLHLCGHDHESDSGAMARAEKRWRARLGLPNGLIERVRS